MERGGMGMRGGQERDGHEGWRGEGGRCRERH